MLWLDEAAGRADAGGKASTLAAARRAGLPVLGGFVVLPDEEIDEREIADRCARLGGERFAVRSSADLEDRAGLSAAGVFASVLDVRAEEVPAAVERVRASALAQPARAYLASRGATAARVRMAVLVQPMARAERLGVLHTAPVEDGALVAEERAPDQAEWGEVVPRAVPLDEALAAGALRLAQLVAAPADVEYAVVGGAPVFLQARPLAAPAPGRDPRRWAVPAEARERSWVRDAEHNPEPLSAAQASLVARLEGQPGLARQLVLHGYLFVEDRAQVDDPPAIPPQELPARFASEIEPACDALLAPLESAAPDPAQLAPALAAFTEVSRRYFGLVSPSIRAARRALDRLLRRSIGEPLSAHAGLLGGTGGRTLARDSALRDLGTATDDAARERLRERYLSAFGAYAPAWDIAVAPDDESPDRVEAAAALVARGPSPEARHGEALADAEAALRRLADRLDAADRDALARLLPIVRAVMTLQEDDDALFFRAQRAVRRPLLALGQRLAQAGRLDEPAQIFDLPVDDALAGSIDAGRARGLRALRESARRLSPPASIRAGVAAWRGAVDRGVLAGLGTSGRAWGRAYVLRDATSPPAHLPPGAVLVLDSVLPSLTWLLPGAAALVTDWGGALSHAATLAREYGIPAVLGTGCATSVLRDGEELLVDADAARVYRLTSG